MMGILTAPLRGLLLVFEEIAERAEQTLYDEEGVRAELTALYHDLQAGTLSEEAFALREMGLVGRLEEIHKRQRTRGHRATR